jgi:hypothetical protein
MADDVVPGDGERLRDRVAAGIVAAERVPPSDDDHSAPARPSVGLDRHVAII